MSYRHGLNVYKPIEAYQSQSESKCNIQVWPTTKHVYKHIWKQINVYKISEFSTCKWYMFRETNIYMFNCIQYRDHVILIKSTMNKLFECRSCMKATHALIICLYTVLSNASPANIINAAFTNPHATSIYQHRHPKCNSPCNSTVCKHFLIATCVLL